MMPVPLRLQLAERANAIQTRRCDAEFAGSFQGERVLEFFKAMSSSF